MFDDFIHMIPRAMVIQWLKSFYTSDTNKVKKIKKKKVLKII